MSREFIDISVADVAAHAPRPQSFYDRYCEDSLDIIEARWPTPAGYVCLVQRNDIPGWIMVRQTPDIGLMKSQADRWQVEEVLEVIASRRVDDRFTALDRARLSLARLAKERKKHTAGVAEWFRVSAEEAKATVEKT